MMEKPSLEVVLQTLDALYRTENAGDKEKASLWLMKLHSSVHAWEIADQLLLLKRDVETSYFAAQTMQNKVRYSFHELPAETHPALRDSLINHLQQLCEAPPLITRQLAMALADLALQMSGWNTVVTDLIQRFGAELSTISVLLDVLIVLPEELNNRSLNLGQNRRKELREELGQNCSNVLSFLDACISSNPANSDITTRVYACMGSWVQLGNFPGDALAQSTLILAPFETLKLLEVPQNLYKAASDCICSTLFMCEDFPSNYNLAQVLQTQVHQLLPVFKAAEESEDGTRAQCLCRIFTEMAETFLYHMVHQPNLGVGGLQTLDLLLACVAHQDYDIADITFNVWYRLSEELIKSKDEKLHELFRPYIQRLIGQLCVHCQLDEDTSKTTVVSDDSDDFTNFRRNVVELIRDVVFLVGSLSCFSELYSNICKPGTGWNTTEACLFVMYAVAPAIHKDESELLPIAVPVLLSISPDTHYAIRATTLRLVSELSEWIDQHPDTLDLVLQFLLDGLQIPALSSYAAKAVQNVCQTCRLRMAPHIDGLLQIIQAADNLSISNDAIIGLLKGATEVISRMSPEVMTTGIASLCRLHTSFLHQLIESPGGEAGPSGSSSDPCVWLDRLAAVFRACVLDKEYMQQHPEHPCNPVVSEVWPFVSNICLKFKNDTRIVERTCRCIRFMIRCVGLGANSILLPLVNLMVSIYREHQHSCFLYLGSVVVDEFGSEVTFQQGLVDFLLALAEVAFPILAAPDGLVQHPDTVDDMFRLCSRFLQRCPLAYLGSPVAATATQCALAAATINHREAFASVMKYFRDLLHLSQENVESPSEHEIRIATVQTFLGQSGVTLMDALVSGFVNLSSVMIADSAEVMWELLKSAKELMRQLLQHSLENFSYGRFRKIEVTPEQKLEFIESVSESDSVDQMMRTIKDFARLYR